jgi:hypothetical protein
LLEAKKKDDWAKSTTTTKKLVGNNLPEKVKPVSASDLKVTKTDEQINPRKTCLRVNVFGNLSNFISFFYIAKIVSF